MSIQEGGITHTCLPLCSKRLHLIHSVAILETSPKAVWGRSKYWWRNTLCDKNEGIKSVLYNFGLTAGKRCIYTCLKISGENSRFLMSQSVLFQMTHPLMRRRIRSQYLQKHSNILVRPVVGAYTSCIFIILALAVTVYSLFSVLSQYLPSLSIVKYIVSLLWIYIYTCIY